MNTKTIARLGLLTAAALALGFIESLIPIAPNLQGVKLGLANAVLLYAIYVARPCETALLMIAKVVLSGLLYSGVSGMLYSLAGGILSLLVMLPVKRIPGVSVVGTSVTGACAHNIGQLAVAAAIVGPRPALAYLPVLLASGLIAGLITGVAAKYVIKGLKNEKS